MMRVIKFKRPGEQSRAYDTETWLSGNPFGIQHAILESAPVEKPKNWIIEKAIIFKKRFIITTFGSGSFLPSIVIAG